MILIREATALDSAAIATVHVESWRSAYRGIIDDDYLNALSTDEKQQMWQQWFARHELASFLRVVDEDVRVTGFALAGPARGQAPAELGEIYVLYLLPGSQKRQQGKRLLRSMARGLEMRGMKSRIVWVLADNPARRFYEKLGGEQTAERPTTVGRQKLVEVAYFWDDLAALTPAKK